MQRLAADPVGFGPARAAARKRARGRDAAGDEPAPEPEPEPEPGLTEAEGDTLLLRVLLIKMVHIKAAHARKVIATLAQQLSLGGILRPGKPGLICIEGTRASCSTFEAELKRQLGQCTRTMGAGDRRIITFRASVWWGRLTPHRHCLQRRAGGLMKSKRRRLAVDLTAS